MKRDPKEQLLLNIAAYKNMLTYPSLDYEGVRQKLMSLWQEYDTTYGEAKTEREVEFRRLYGHP